MPDASVLANGRPTPCRGGEPLPEFLRRHGFEPGQVVVEHNGGALTPAEAARVVLADGDRLEIVRIVAGG